MDSSCIFCGSPAQRLQPDTTRDLFEWRCERCGHWRLGLARAIAILRINDAARQSILRRGQRYGLSGRPPLV